MNKPNITPGKWEISRQVSTLVVGKTHDGYERSIASAGGFTRNTHDETPENEANAKAISAVPQMIEALMTALKDECHILSPESHDQLKTALRDAGVEES